MKEIKKGICPNDNSDNNDVILLFERILRRAREERNRGKVDGSREVGSLQFAVSECRMFRKFIASRSVLASIN